MHLGLVLHAHLPHVRHPEHARSLEERWLFEALWESYLPLLDVLDDVVVDDAPRLTLSISPTLIDMLGDPFLLRRFDEHLASLDAFATRARATVDAALVPAIDAHRARLAAGRARLDRIGGDVVGAFVALSRRSVVELAVTSATHAVLPNLGETASIRAQIRLGRRVFEKVTRREPVGFWLPECAYDERVGRELGPSGARYTVLDAHGVELARPAPLRGIGTPILGAGRVAFFGRDPAASAAVWSRQRGYPGNPVYRDFYRDLGFDVADDVLRDQAGPAGSRVTTGLKPYAVSESEDKRPWAPAHADALAVAHAEDFVQLVERSGYADDEIATVPFDAELFGHWWFEGPTFLRALLDATGPDAAVRSVSLGHHLETHPRDLPRSAPASSTWGRGGHQAVWASPEVVPYVRHLHHAERTVLALDRVVRDTLAPTHRRSARLHAIRQLLLAQSSDWAFMVAHGDTAAYAERRISTHLANVERLAHVARSPVPSPEDATWLDSLDADTPLFSALEEDDYADAFDPF